MTGAFAEAWWQLYESTFPASERRNGVLHAEAMKDAAEDKEAAYRIGTEWCAMQCKDLIRNGVPAVHFYTMGKTENIVNILKECF